MTRLESGNLVGSGLKALDILACLLEMCEIRHSQIVNVHVEHRYGCNIGCIFGIDKI